MTIPTSDFPAAGPADDIALTDQAGHLIRRAHQLAVALFHENLGRDVTPVQYAVLRALEARPGIDQVTLAAEIALDTSTTAETAVRLERKGWIVRELLARRQRALYLTPEGQALLAGLRAPMMTMPHSTAQASATATTSPSVAGPSVTWQPRRLVGRTLSAVNSSASLSMSSAGGRRANSSSVR